MFNCKCLYRVIILLLVSLLVLQFPEEVLAEEVSLETPPASYLAIGDSIAKGYSCDGTEIKPYPALVLDELNRRGEKDDKIVVLDNIAKNGISTARFNSSLLEKETVIAQIKQADVITVTIGANDLIDEFKRASQDVLGQSERFLSLSDATAMLESQVKAHPTLVIKAISAISKWDYDAFEQDYCKMLDEIIALKKADTQIVVTNIYNPATGIGMPGPLGIVVDDVIAKMNRIINAHAEEYGYSIVNLMDSKICDYVQSDGLHPTQEGQELIAKAMVKKITWGLEQEEKQELLIEEEKVSSRKKSSSMIAIIGVGITGILLIILGVSKGKKKRERKSEGDEDEDTISGD